jgi:hypothetical protein
MGYPFWIFIISLCIIGIIGIHIIHIYYTPEPLAEAAEKLIEFIEENGITDEKADDGDGYTNEWCSNEFKQLINEVKKNL